MGLPDGGGLPPETGIALVSHRAVPTSTAPSQHRGMDRSCKKKWEGREEAELAKTVQESPVPSPLLWVAQFSFVCFLLQAVVSADVCQSRRR